MNDPTTERFGGIDWANDGHAAAVVDTAGRKVVEFDVAHDVAGLDELCRRLIQERVRRVAIERPDGPVVDRLLEAGLKVVVVSSRSVKALRERYGTAGNKSDRGDAYILADCLRTDGHRWRSLQPDSPATLTLRHHVRARKDLVKTRVAVANQLRAHLQIVFPGAIGLFAELDSPISLRFLQRFPSQARADWLSTNRLAAWLKANHYPGRNSPDRLYAHLRDATRATSSDNHGAVTIAYVTTLTTLRAQIDQLETRLDELLDTHPDTAVFRSLPRCGTVRAATLIAEIGDCRARFPDPESLACLAGVVPSTKASGRQRIISYRWSADKQLRNAICDFAGDSWQANTWAEHRYRQLRAAGKTHPHAQRILARSWTSIIWRCWQDSTPYDPAKHRAHQRLTQQTA